MLKKLKTQDHLFDSIASLVIPSKIQRERGRERKGGREGEREERERSLHLISPYYRS